jgi:exonuclease III
VGGNRALIEFWCKRCCVPYLHWGAARRVSKRSKRKYVGARGEGGTNVRVISHNINGGVLRKLDQIRSAMRETGAIVALQEVHLWADEHGAGDLVSRLAVFGINVFLSLEKRPRGILNPSLHPHTGVAWLLDGEMDAAAVELIPGRALRLQLECAGNSVSLVNLYAPPQRKVREEFYQKLVTKLDSDDVVIGDFNDVEDAQLDRASGKGKALNLTSALGGKSDAWRFYHPAMREWTFMRCNLKSDGESTLHAARIDSVWCSLKMMEQVLECEITHVSWEDMDHSPIVLTLLTQVQSVPEGLHYTFPPRIRVRGRSKKQIEEYCNEVEHWIDMKVPVFEAMRRASAKWVNHMPPIPGGPDRDEILTDQVRRWRTVNKNCNEAMALVVRAAAVESKTLLHMASHKLSKLPLYFSGVNKLEKGIANACREVARKVKKVLRKHERARVVATVGECPRWGGLQSAGTVSKKGAAKVAAEAANLNKTVHKLAATVERKFQKVRWSSYAESDEKAMATSKSAIHKKAKRASRAMPLSLKDGAGKQLLTEEENLGYAHKYFGELFCKEPSPMSMEALSTLLAKPRPKRTEAEEQILAPVSDEEWASLIRAFARNKASPDNLPAELYKWLGPKASEAAREEINKVFRNRCVPDSWKSSTVAPLHKGGTNDVLDNYRTLTLLQVRYKCLTHIISRRMWKVCNTNKIVLPEQGGFRKGFHIAGPIARLLQVMEFARKNKTELHVVYYDFSKAYDSVAHDYVWEMLKYYGFSDTLVAFFRQMYTGMTSKVRTPLGLTDSFTVYRGVRQGCPLSCLVFLLSINPLLERLKESVPQTANGKFGGAYADDLVVFSEKAEQMTIFNKWIDVFCAATTMAINIKKTAHTALNVRGEWPVLYVGGKVIAHMPANVAYKYLGIWVAADGSWKTQLDETIAWLNNKLSMVKCANLVGGRLIEVVNMQIFGKLRYAMGVLMYPDAFLKQIDSQIFAVVKLKLRWRQMMCRDPLYLPTRLMGYGLLAAKDVNAQSIITVGYYKILNGIDGSVCENAWRLVRPDVALTAPLFVDPPKWPKGVAEIGSTTVDCVATAAQFLGWSLRKEMRCTEVLSSLPLPRAMREVERRDEEVLVCTDGSFTRGKAGSGVYTSAGPGIAFRTIGKQSVFNAEAQAATAALRWIEREGCRALLLIDNLAVENAINRGYPGDDYWSKCKSGSYLQECVDIRDRLGDKLKVMWYPSHADAKLAEGGKKADMVAQARVNAAGRAAEYEHGNECADNLAGRGCLLQAESAEKAWKSKNNFSLWRDNYPLDGGIGSHAAIAVVDRRISEMKDCKTNVSWKSKLVDSDHSFKITDAKSAYDHHLFAFALQVRTKCMYVKSVVRHFEDQSRLNIPAKDACCDACRKGNGDGVKETPEHLLNECAHGALMRDNIDRAIGDRVLKVLAKAAEAKGKPAPTSVRFTSWVTGKQIEAKVEEQEEVPRAVIFYTTSLPELWGWGGCWPAGMTNALKSEGVSGKDIATLAKGITHDVVEAAKMYFKLTRDLCAQKLRKQLNTNANSPPPPPPPLPELGKGPQAKGEKEFEGLTPVQFWHKVLDGKCSAAVAGKAMSKARSDARLASWGAKAVNIVKV